MCNVCDDGVKPARQTTVKRLIKDYLLYLKLKDTEPVKAISYLTDCAISVRLLSIENNEISNQIL